MSAAKITFSTRKNGDGTYHGLVWSGDEREPVIRQAGLPITVHPHMLRHSCGYSLDKSGYGAVEIQEYLGMRDASYALRYFEDGRTGDAGSQVKKSRAQRLRYLRLSMTKSDKG